MSEPFAPDHRRRFWTLHIAGWGAYAVLNYFVGIEVTGKPVDYFMPSILYALGGIAITWCLRFLFLAVWNLKPLLLAALGGLGSTLAAGAFTAFRSWSYSVYYGRRGWLELAIQEYFNLWDLYISLYVIGTWSALYFGIKHYHTVQRQKEGLLRATIAAHHAQLQLIRYQLNPHFLFNTLNAISTLVLEGDREGAARLVNGLSAFLRHGLESDPMRKATLDEELRVLELYLDIEHTRFEDRLAVNYDIADEARGAMMPGMLLQPLVEHVIRQRVARSEQGGTISITAFIEDGKLCVRVANSAHGGTRHGARQAPGRTPADLGGMRERLNVLYGEAYDLRLESLGPDGFGITISIPLEHGKRQNPGSADR